ADQLVEAVAGHRRADELHAHRGVPGADAGRDVHRPRGTVWVRPTGLVSPSARNRYQVAGVRLQPGHLDLHSVVAGLGEARDRVGGLLLGSSGLQERLVMGRRFNTAGPCLPAYHYMIPPLRRLPEAPGLVAQLGYFVVHAPRQTGKTTALSALASELTRTGRYAALHFSCELGRAAGENYGAAQRAILHRIQRRARIALPPDLQPPPWPEAPDENLLGDALAAWALACPRPLVLFFDEIDALYGQSLISVLSQLLDGYNERPDGFPASVALCGLRDVRDYKAASGGDPTRLGTASPFNIKLKSLRLGDFPPDEVRELYGQHTAETGQQFTQDAVERAIELTAGQPWLVNALAREIVEEIGVPAPE